MYWNLDEATDKALEMRLTLTWDVLKLKGLICLTFCC